MYDPQKIFEGLEAAAEDRAKAEYEAHLLERHGEILQAELMCVAKQNGTAIGMCKEVARTDPKWRVHIEGEAEAIRNRSRARARYENLRILAEARRTEESSTRALTR